MSNEPLRTKKKLFGFTAVVSLFHTLLAATKQEKFEAFRFLIGISKFKLILVNMKPVLDRNLSQSCFAKLLLSYKLQTNSFEFWFSRPWHFSSKNTKEITQIFMARFK